MTYIGIDTGMHGAIAWFPQGRSAEVQDMPVLKSEGRLRYDACELVLLLSRLCQEESFAVVEQINAVPMFGKVANFKMGYGYGLVLGVLNALNISHETVHPRRWKSAMLDGKGKDKTASILQAKSLFPLLGGSMTVDKKDGRAEALLLAEYGRRSTAGKWING